MPTFRPEERIRTTPQFDAIFTQRRSVGNGLLLLFGRLNQAEITRLGLSVSKKLTRTAIVRNRIRRQIKEAFRFVKADLPRGMDLVAIPRRIQNVTVEDLKAAFHQLVPQLERRLMRDGKEKV